MVSEQPGIGRRDEDAAAGGCAWVSRPDPPYSKCPYPARWHVVAWHSVNFGQIVSILVCSGHIGVGSAAGQLIGCHRYIPTCSIPTDLDGMIARGCLTTVQLWPPERLN